MRREPKAKLGDNSAKTYMEGRQRMPLLSDNEIQTHDKSEGQTPRKPANSL